MGGMPSSHGLEWRTDGQSRKRYDENFDKIDWSDDGTKKHCPHEMNGGIIYYCRDCAAKNLLPIVPIIDSVGGYCYLCGVDNLYAGQLGKGFVEKLGIKIPSFEELDATR